MKKFISILLALIMALSLTGAAFAREDITPVVVVRGMGEYVYLQNEDGSKTQVFAPDSKSILEAVAQFAPGLAKSILTNDYSDLGPYVTKLKELFIPMSCNDDGTPKYNLTVDYTPESVGNYPEKLNNTQCSEWGIAKAVSDAVGTDNTYFFTYLWNRSPLRIADDLNSYIENVKAETGAKKVSLIACSMGGTITMSYLQKYGSDSVKNVVLASTAFLGTEIVGRLFVKDLDISLYDALDYFGAFFGPDFAESAMQIIKKGLMQASISGSVDKFLDNLTANLLDIAYSDIFLDTFVTMPGIWCLVPESYYEDAKHALFPDGNEPSFIATYVDYYMNNVQSHAADIINEAEDNGVNVYITASYTCPGIPVYNGNESYTDNLIDLKYASGCATVADYGKKVVPVDDTLKNCTAHDHISPDKIVDASTCILPDQTWFIKNIGHMGYEYGKDSCGLLVYLLTSEEKVSVYSNDKYPQFVNVNDVTGNFEKVSDTVSSSDSSFYQLLFDFVLNILNYLISLIGKFA